MSSVTHEVRTLLIICLIALVGLTTAAFGQSNPSRSNQKQIRSQKQKIVGLRKKRQPIKTGVTANFPQPKSEDGIEGDQKERDDWFIDQRKYPFDKLPDEARRRAWLSRPADNSMMNATAASIWQSIGPAPERHRHSLPGELGRNERPHKHYRRIACQCSDRAGRRSCRRYLEIDERRDDIRSGQRHAGRYGGRLDRFRTGQSEYRLCCDGRLEERVYGHRRP